MSASVWNPGGTTLTPAANGTGTVTEKFTTTSSQTLFNLTTFTYVVGVNSLQVYVNGVLQALGQDYTETSVSSITLTAMTQSGDVVTIIGIINITNIVPTPVTTTPLGGVAINDFSINHASVNGQSACYPTNPAGWNTDIGKMTVDLCCTPVGYFAANPNGHFAIILRQDPALTATAARGQGVAIGNGTGFAYPSDLNPTPMLETWFNGYPGGNFLWPNTDTARSIGMQDGQTYRFIIDSTKTNEGNRYLRYRQYRLEAAGNWLAMVDSGDVLDHNVWADLTQSGFLVGHVFESNLSTWSLNFTNVNVTWGPAETAVPDQSIKLSRYGAQLEGGLTFLGAGRKISFPFSSGPSLGNWASIQSSTLNASTSLVTKPNGTGTNANSLYSNSSSSTTTYQAVTYGIAGAVGLIETFAYAAVDPVLGINIGAANRVATFKVTGLNILGATYDIGQALPLSANLTNFGGYNQSVFAASGNLDWDAVAGIGVMAAYMTSTYDKQKVEDMIRPVWCLLGQLIKNLKDKKVI